MIRNIFAIGVVAIWMAGAAVYAQPSMSNGDVIKMVNAGLSEEFITNLIDQQGSRLSSDVSSLIEMKQAGANERILRAVVNKSPSREPLNSDSVIRLVKAGFSDNFIADLLMKQSTKFSPDASRIVELKQAGVSERMLALMVGEGNARTLPSGSEVSVRLIDGIDSEKDNPGAEFRASLEDPIVIDGQTVAPKGADARVRLAEEKSSGKFTGKAELTIQLLSVVVNGKSVPIQTSSVTEYSKSQTGSTAKKAAAVGAVGAIIGAIAGGGKGAAIGALSGAGAGTATQALTRGKSVRVPSETILDFRLEAPIHIREMR